jgi:hypothetical protein
MKKDMALKWEKVKAKGQARVVSNFKKKWIPFVLEVAQANLRKANEAQLSRYRKGMIFLSSAFAEKFDEDGFEDSWRKRLDPDLDLRKIHSGFEWISKYMGRKDKTDAVEYLLYHVKTISVLSINRHSGRYNFVIKHHLQEESLVKRATFFFMRLLDGLPVSSIRKCIGCGHYFLHLTKREKEYCTPSCASRSIQQKKREDLRKNHPRKYKVFLKEQRARMRRLRKSATD